MISSNIIVESQLGDRLRDLEQKMEGTVLAFCGSLVYGIDEQIRDAVESIGNKKEKLLFLIETSGGYIEVVKRIVDTLRRHFTLVDFIIPNYAMSAGTILVMSGDAIYMDYFSVLGPIDPQVQRRDGQLFPALGYLIQYERLIKKSKKGELTTAELNYLIERFDPAELYAYEQARELSKAFLKEWLVKYKFKNWKKTETRKLPVTKAMKTRRASEVAKKLNDTEFWHSHGQGISMEVLRRNLRLLIEDFEQDSELNKIIRTYHKLLTDYMMRRSHKAIIHIDGKYIPII